MDVDDIAAGFEAAIDGAVAGGGARLEAGAKARLSAMAARAAREISFFSDEGEQGPAVGAGVAAYRILVGDMVAFARKIGKFPSLDASALDGVLMAKGPNPPFW